MPARKRRPSRPHAPPPDSLTPAQRLELADVMCRDAALLRAAGRETLRSLSKARNARP